METISGANLARVLLVDGHAMFRQVVGKSLSECDDLRVVADVGSVVDARRTAAHSGMDLAIVSVQLPDGSGLDLLREFKSIAPGMKVVILAGNPDEDMLIGAVSADADGYMLKESSFDQLVAVIRAVLAGSYFYEPSVCNSLIRRLVRNGSVNEMMADARRVDLAGLSARECQVVELLSRGMTNKEIARQLSISVSTTKTHVSKAFKRLGISSRRELLPRFYDLLEVSRDSNRSQH